MTAADALCQLTDKLVDLATLTSAHSPGEAKEGVCPGLIRRVCVATRYSGNLLSHCTRKHTSDVSDRASELYGEKR